MKLEDWWAKINPSKKDFQPKDLFGEIGKPNYFKARLNKRYDHASKKNKKKGYIPFYDYFFKDVFKIAIKTDTLVRLKMKNTEKLKITILKNKWFLK